MALWHQGDLSQRQAESADTPESCPGGGSEGEETISRVWEKRRNPLRTVCEVLGYSAQHLQEWKKVTNLVLWCPWIFLVHIYTYIPHIYIWIFVNICIYIPQQHIQISVESSKFSNLIPRGCISLIYFQLREKRHMDTHTQSNQSQMTAIYIYVWSFEVFHYGNLAKCM